MFSSQLFIDFFGFSTPLSDLVHIQLLVTLVWALDVTVGGRGRVCGFRAHVVWVFPRGNTFSQSQAQEASLRVALGV